MASIYEKMPVAGSPARARTWNLQINSLSRYRLRHGRINVRTLPAYHHGLQMSEFYAADNVPKIGVGSGNRTRDSHVGNVILYQLSYTHMEHVEGIEPSSSGWKPGILAVELHVHWWEG